LQALSQALKLRRESLRHLPRSKRTIERIIGKLSREITEIDKHFYSGFEEKDRNLFASMLERKRDDMVRVAVLQLHTATEDVLTGWITCRMLGVRPKERKKSGRTHSGRALRKILSGNRSIGFERKLHLAVVLGLITARTQKRLEELNSLRNKCSHNWLLNVPVRRGRRPQDTKPPLLLYRGRDLHKVAVLKDMTAEYGPLYARLFVKYLDG
jgi:hypothetical protein